MKETALETLKVYGVGTCGPPGFYGTIGELQPSLPSFLPTPSSSSLDASSKTPSSLPSFTPSLIQTDVHRALEANISAFLQTPSTIIYAQDFSTISSVIPSFAKRGDIIVADRLCNFAIQKGLQISRSTIKWYDHGDMSSLEAVLESVTREAKRKGGKLTRRFIVTEGMFENDGFISDLEKLVSPVSLS